MDVLGAGARRGADGRGVAEVTTRAAASAGLAKPSASGSGRPGGRPGSGVASPTREKGKEPASEGDAGAPQGGGKPAGAPRGVLDDVALGAMAAAEAFIERWGEDVDGKDLVPDVSRAAMLVARGEAGQGPGAVAVPSSVALMRPAVSMAIAEAAMAATVEQATDLLDVVRCYLVGARAGRPGARPVRMAGAERAAPTRAPTRVMDEGPAAQASPSVASAVSTLTAGSAKPVVRGAPTTFTMGPTSVQEQRGVPGGGRPAAAAGWGAVEYGAQQRTSWLQAATGRGPARVAEPMEIGPDSIVPRAGTGGGTSTWAAPGPSAYPGYVGGFVAQGAMQGLLAPGRRDPAQDHLVRRMLSEKLAQALGGLTLRAGASPEPFLQAVALFGAEAAPSGVPQLELELLLIEAAVSTLAERATSEAATRELGAEMLAGARSLVEQKGGSLWAAFQWVVRQQFPVSQYTEYEASRRLHQVELRRGGNFNAFLRELKQACIEANLGATDLLQEVAKRMGRKVGDALFREFHAVAASGEIVSAERIRMFILANWEHLGLAGVYSKEVDTGSSGGGERQRQQRQEKQPRGDRAHGVASESRGAECWDCGAKFVPGHFCDEKRARVRKEKEAKEKSGPSQGGERRSETMRPPPDKSGSKDAGKREAAKGGSSSPAPK